MIRKTKGEGESSYKDSRIIGTQDIYLSTNPEESLDDRLEKQEEEIQQLKKYTKWYVKYGGMGSGSGSGGQSTQTGYKVYLIAPNGDPTKLGDSEKEVDKVFLSGAGQYRLVFSLTKTLGHSFTVSYRFGSGPNQEITFLEGQSSREVNVYLTERTTFYFTIIDNNTENEVCRDESCVIIPESYKISTSLVKGESPVSPGDQIIRSSIEELVAKFSYEFSTNVELYYNVLFKLGDSDWINGIEGAYGRFTDIPLSDEAGKTTGVVSINFGEKIFPLIPEESAGQTIYIKLAIGDTELPQSGNTIYLTILPDNNYFIMLQDIRENSALYETQKSAESESANQISIGTLPFIVRLYHATSTPPGDTVVITIDYFSGETWSTVISTDQYVPDNTDVYLSSFGGGLSVKNGGIYKITASLNKDQSIKTIRYFSVMSSSTEWEWHTDNLRRVSKDSGVAYYYIDGGDPSGYNKNKPYLDQKLQFYKNSKTIELNNIPGLNSSNFCYNIALGLQYDENNTDTKDMVSLDISGGTYTIHIKQNSILYGDTSLLNGFYFPKDNRPHLLNLVINYLYRGNQGSVYEVVAYIDGVIEGISSDGIVREDFHINRVTINPDELQVLELNLFEVEITTFGVDAGLSNTSYNRLLFDPQVTSYYNAYLASQGSTEIVDNLSFNDTLANNFGFNQYGPYILESSFIDLIKRKTDVLNFPILILQPNADDFYEGRTGIITPPEGFWEANNWNDRFFKLWFFARWPEDSGGDRTKSPISLNTRVTYIPGNVKGDDFDLDKYRIADNFVIDIQGSSTRNYGIKNLELSIQQSGNDNEVKLFTPYYDKSDNTTLLPEKSFTLKADMVDSSTCNNSAIGSFINANTEPLGGILNEARNNEELGDHIKNCLLGFPVLVFLNVIHTEGNNIIKENELYYAGIYNFNLGRNSHVNLGYYGSRFYNALSDKLGEESNSSFKIVTITDTGGSSENILNLKSDLLVTEISNGQFHFDFSQSDPTILFPTEAESNKSFSMFSMEDSINLEDNQSSKDDLQGAIDSISRAGGYLFDRLKKNRIEVLCNGTEKRNPYNLETNEGVSRNYVSDYTRQAKRRENSSDIYIPEGSKRPDATDTELIDCIGFQKLVDGEYVNNTPKVDLLSLVEYYVICMTFGMTDSVLKNMQLKSWGRTDRKRTIYPAFYDMDTALGIDNKGDETDYFAFSDYWSVVNREDETEDDVYIADEADIYPDFFSSKGTSSHGFDIPSSFLFAIAKYANLDLLGSEIKSCFPTTSYNGIENIEITPVNIYSIYRSTSLSNASNFIDNYFSGRLDNIPNSLKNLNFRSKYAKLAYWKENRLFNPDVFDMERKASIKLSDLTDKEKFSGTGIYKKTDWLKSRLHLLDAYFNINSQNYPIKWYSEIDKTWYNLTDDATGITYIYPKNTSEIGFSGNDDIVIVSQIFDANTSSNIANGSSFKVKALPYTPIILTMAANAPKAFLIGNNGELNEGEFKIPISTAGVQIWSVFGSKALTNINNLGVFGLNRANVTSDKLKEVLYGTTSVDVDGIFNINTPNASLIKFSNSKYNGSLTLAENPWTRLSEIDLSNSRMNVRYVGSLPALTKLSLNKLKNSGSDIIIPNAPNLTNVSFNDSSLQTLNVFRWASKIHINGGSTTRNGYASNINVNIKKLIISGSVKSRELSEELYIENVANLEEVSLEGFRRVVINRCPKLNTVTIDDSLQNLEVTNCSTSSRSFSVGYGESSEANVINIPGHSKQTDFTLKLQGTPNFTTVKAGNNTKVILGTNALRSCSQLRYLDGSYLINGTNVFYYSDNFTLEKSDEPHDIVDISVSSNLTSLANMFTASSSGKGSITFEKAKEFLEEKVRSPKNIENIAGIFQNQQKIGVDWGFDNYISLSGYTKLITTTSAFNGCGINYYSFGMFNFGSESNKIINIDRIYWSGGVIHAKVDFLQGLGSRLGSFTNISNSGSSSTYLFYDISGNVLEEVRMKDVLSGLTNLSSINSFGVIQNTTVNLEECFINCTNTLVSLSNFLTTSSNATNLVSSSLNACTKFTSMHGCFSNTFKDDEIDLYSLFSEDQWKQITSFATSDLKDNSNHKTDFFCGKTITLDHFNTVRGWLSSNTSIKNVNNVFANCNITDCGTSTPELKISGSNIEQLHRTFYNLKAWQGAARTTNEVPVLIENFFENLPNVSSCHFTFAKIYVSGYIHANFFFKRTGYNYNIEDEYGFWPNIENYEYSEEPGYLYVYKAVTKADWTRWRDNDYRDNNWPEIKPDGSVDFKDWVVKKLISNIEENNVVTSKKYPVIVRLRRDINNNNGFENPVAIEELVSTTPLDVTYYEYNNRNITNIEGMFSEATFTIPYFYFEDDKEKHPLDEYKIIDSNGTTYDRYFTGDDDSIRLGHFRKSYEREDIGYESDKVVSFANGEITVGGSIFKNFGITQTSKGYPFIAPDFFYGVSKTCKIDECFASTNSTSSNSDNRLEGYIPKHLFTQTTQLTGLRNWIHYLNILPLKDGTSNRYVFVPEEFFSGNQISSLSGAFNFRIRVPEKRTHSDEADNENYYLFYKNSVTSQISSVSDVFPSVAAHASTSGGSDGIVVSTRNMTAGTYNFGYHLAIDSGINIGLDEMDCFSSKTRYESLISSDLLYVLSGKVWSIGLSNIELVNPATSSIFTGIIYYGDNSYGFNGNIDLTQTTGDFRKNSRIFGFIVDKQANRTIRILRTVVGDNIDIWQNVYGGEVSGDYLIL